MLRRLFSVLDLHDSFDFRNFLFDGTFDAHLESHGRARAHAAGADEMYENFAVFDVDELS